MFILIKDKKKEYVINTNRIIEIKYNCVHDCLEIEYESMSYVTTYYVNEIKYFKRNKCYLHDVKELQPSYLIDCILSDFE